MNTIAIPSESAGTCADRTSYKSNIKDGLAEKAAEIIVLWNGIVQDVVHQRIDRKGRWSFTVGEAHSCDFLVPADALEGEDKVSLVEIQDGLVTVSILPEAHGEVTYENRTRVPLTAFLEDEEIKEIDSSQRGRTIKLAPHSRVEMKLGSWTFCIRSTQRLEKLSWPFKLDWSSGCFLGVSAAMHAVFFFLVYLIPPNANGLMLDPNATDNRFVKYLLMPNEVKISVVPDLTKIPDRDQAGGKVGNRHTGTEGKAGDRTAPKTGKRLGIKGPKNNPDPHMARLPTKEMATTAGILRYLSSAAAPTSPFGRKTALGVDPENALGGLQGNEIGVSFGYGGLGINGTGRGGGGSGEGTLGVGHLGTIGSGGGRGSGSYVGRYKGTLSTRKTRGPSVSTSAAIVRGSLSKTVIRRVVRRHINEIRFCYEQGLRKRPDISGRVEIKFLISGLGVVQSSAVKSSTVDDPSVESCITRTVRRMTFPQPEGGGIVIVTYPFTLTSPES